MIHTKYVLYNSKLGYFKPGNSKSLHYNETDFVPTIDKATHYTTKKRALKTAFAIFPAFSVNVIPIEIRIREMDAIDISKQLKIDLAEHQANVDKISALNGDETEALSIKKWNAYKVSKSFVRTYKEVV